MTDAPSPNTPMAADWLDLAGVPALIAGRCSSCGRAHVPRRRECPWCAGDAVRAERHADGVVVAATTTVLPVPGGDGPFHTIVLVDLGDGLIAAGRAVGDVNTGDAVTVTPSTLDDGDAATVVHAFTPVGEASRA